MDRRRFRMCVLAGACAALLAGPGMAQGEGTLDPVGRARDTTAGPLGQREDGARLDLSIGSEDRRVGAGTSMTYAMGDERAELFARLPNGLALVVSRTRATFTASGVLPVTARGTVDAEVHGTGTARLRVDSQAVVDDLLDQLETLSGQSLPSAAELSTVNGTVDATGQANLTIDGVRGSAGIDKRTRGVMVAIPVASTGLSFFAGARQVEEYVVASVQGFHYAYDYQGSATGTVSSPTLGRQASRTASTSGGGEGDVAVNASRGHSWGYGVAVVGVGYRGESGGFHMIADLQWSGSTPDVEGYVDVGELKQLEMPGNLRDVELGGDFRVGGFSAGVNAKLLTFAGYAVGGGLDLFVNQHFASADLDVGLAYSGEVRGPMADQTAALQVAFQPSRGTRVTLVAAVRVLSSYMPGLDHHQELDRDWSASRSTSGTRGRYDYAGTATANADVHGEVDIQEDEAVRHRVLFYPGVRLDLLETGLTVGGGPIVTQEGEVTGGHGAVGYEIIPNSTTVSGSLTHEDELGTSGALNLNISF